MMSLKKQVHDHDKAVQKQLLPQSHIQDLKQLPSQTSPAALIQQATLDSYSLTPRDVLRLQGTVGNRATGRLLARSVIQRALIQNANTPQARILDNIEAFDELKSDDILLDDQDNKQIQFIRVMSYKDKLVLVGKDSTAQLFQVDTAQYLELQAPQILISQGSKIVKKEKSEVLPDYFVGVEFKTGLVSARQREIERALIKEVIIDEKREGFFTHYPSVVQQDHNLYMRGGLNVDRIGIAADSVEALDSLARAEGALVQLQYHTYLNSQLKEEVIPRSGFRLTKILKDGKLFIKREAVALTAAQKGEVFGHKDVAIDL